MGRRMTHNLKTVPQFMPNDGTEAWGELLGKHAGLKIALLSMQIVQYR